MRQAIVLLSGGIDSLVCAERERAAGTLRGCVFVDYGHPAQVPEGWKAFSYCGERGVDLRVVHAFGLALGDMQAQAGARIVPGRNAVLIALAANQAHAMGGTHLVVGAIADDQQDYEDCRPAFFAGVAGAVGMPVDHPLIGMAKFDVVRMAATLGLRQSDAWSCYGAGPSPCGVCPSCELAGRAWRRV